jgi:uncharacterized protein YigE (DUF2233 family)
MKIRYLVLISLIILLMYYVYRTHSSVNTEHVNSPLSSQLDSVPGSLPPKSVKTIEDDGHEISYNLFTASPSEITLYSNLRNSTDSASARMNHQCSSLINSGFYTKENTHLGLFIAEGNIIHPSIGSTLVDGFLTIRDDASVSISFEEPDDTPHIALQSGPIIRTDSSLRPLRLIEDKFARRSLAGVTSDGKMVFITVYFNNQEYSGPLLSRTPYILEKIMSVEALKITDAFNLDGGSASAFISDGITLSEIAPIGGFFCIKSKNTVQ